jgi:hypothetical protein
MQVWIWCPIAPESIAAQKFSSLPIFQAGSECFQGKHRGSARARRNDENFPYPSVEGEIGESDRGKPPRLIAHGRARRRVRGSFRECSEAETPRAPLAASNCTSRWTRIRPGVAAGACFEARACRGVASPLARSGDSLKAAAIARNRIGKPVLTVRNKPHNQLDAMARMTYATANCYRNGSNMRR